MAKIKKQLIPIDNSSTVGTIGYGYTSKREFKKDLEKMTGEKLSKDELDLIKKIKVQEIPYKGDYAYRVENVCPKCGVWSFTLLG